MKVIEKVDDKYIINPNIAFDKVYHLRYKNELVAVVMVKSYGDEYIMLDFLIRYSITSYHIESFYSSNYPEKAKDIELILLVEDTDEK